MKKTLFITSDVHSYYDILMEELNKAGYDYNNDSHIFVSLGDLLDRGDKPKECLEFVNSLPPEQKILIRGNHEDLMEDALRGVYFSAHDFHNGTAQTAAMLTGRLLNIDPDYKILFDMCEYEPYTEYVNSCVDYGIVGDNIFVHGWVPCFDNNHKMCIAENWETGDWATARWINGMSAWGDGARLKGKTIFCGHWHTSWGHTELHNETVERFDPFIDEGIVALDACCAYSHKLNVYKLEVED